MKPDDRVFLANNIGDYQSRFNMFIQGLKKDNFKVSDKPEKAQANFQISHYKAIFKSVYVSPSSLAKSLISSRDMANTHENLITKLHDCAGSTQAFLRHLSTTDTEICLIIVNYAALSTVPDDVYALES
ncbi:hypothetical protein INT47_008181 [Mucor saturninus]|uniref:Uncharacterized protein n=1 Tax=Mucor saturninus TaxID=64648 RepID=A0A8H7V6W1_9FUNG|nr:hypothetical protein INT47_008181 [Mucor saturninus]